MNANLEHVDTLASLTDREIQSLISMHRRLAKDHWRSARRLIRVLANRRGRIPK